MPLATVLMTFNVEVLGLCIAFVVLTRPLRLQAAPAAVEAITKLTAFRGFAGTSVLIIVGVATDTARKVRQSLPWGASARPQVTPVK